ncbi:tryptophan dimethylallyltransferase-domain-containing protein [Aspergillus pseudoustus]|uniref:Tryptophan dimethylallyltransferase-domain-containing protein n=1 Tax=Aspergillus pseudoustus TaxID=1810923 RepID=A0ABR4IQT7_9EURO
MVGTKEASTNGPTTISPPPTGPKLDETARTRTERNGIDTPTPFQTISKFITFPSLGQEQWWKATGPVLSRILAAARYPLDQQYQYLTSITRRSINYQQHGSGSGSGTGLEPPDTYSGTDRDPFNQDPATELVGALTRLGIPGFDSQLFTLFSDEPTLTVADRCLALDRGILLGSQQAFGFDLKDGGTVVKGYTDGDGRPTTSSRNSSSSSSKDKLDCFGAFTTVGEYVSSADANVFSWDYFAPAQSRLKYYCVCPETTCAKVEEVWTAGGHIPTSEGTAHATGLPYLRKLWETLQLREARVRQFSGGKGSYSDDSIEEQDEAPMLWNYEMRGGDLVPLRKYCFPLYGVNNLVCVRRLAEFFEWMGWSEVARDYEETVRGFYPDRVLSKTAWLLLWVSFAYTAKEGVYLSVYCYRRLD